MAAAAGCGGAWGATIQDGPLMEEDEAGASRKPASAWAAEACVRLRAGRDARLEPAQHLIRQSQS